MFLNQDVKHIAVLIDSAPEVKGLPIHLDHDLVQKPLVAGLGSVATDDVGE